jgi:acetyl-CoA carboxylase carboxyl transferase subunit alpha
MKVTAQDLAELGVIDRIVKEPVGGAHRDRAATAQALGDAIEQELEALSGKSAKQLRRLREDRFLGIGDRRRSRGKRRAGT